MHFHTRQSNFIKNKQCQETADDKKGGKVKAEEEKSLSNVI